MQVVKNPASGSAVLLQPMFSNLQHENRLTAKILVFLLKVGCALFCHPCPRSGW